MARCCVRRLNHVRFDQVEDVVLHIPKFRGSVTARADTIYRNPTLSEIEKGLRMKQKCNEIKLKEEKARRLL